MPINLQANVSSTTPIDKNQASNKAWRKVSTSTDGGSVILAGARTPIGRFHGALATMTATDLGAIAIKAALQRAGVDPAHVDYVIMGQVVTAGTGQNPARIAAVEAGIPMSVPLDDREQGVPIGH